MSAYPCIVLPTSLGTTPRRLWRMLDFLARDSGVRLRPHSVPLYCPKPLSLPPSGKWLNTWMADARETRSDHKLARVYPATLDGVGEVWLLRWGPDIQEDDRVEPGVSFELLSSFDLYQLALGSGDRVTVHLGDEEAA